MEMGLGVGDPQRSSRGWGRGAPLPSSAASRRLGRGSAPVLLLEAPPVVLMTPSADAVCPASGPSGCGAFTGVTGPLAPLSRLRIPLRQAIEVLSELRQVLLVARGRYFFPHPALERTRRFSRPSTAVLCCCATQCAPTQQSAQQERAPSPPLVHPSEPTPELPRASTQRSAEPFRGAETEKFGSKLQVSPGFRAPVPPAASPPAPQKRKKSKPTKHS